jgi:Cd2+/Zn2+-exporting ATPase
MDSVNSAQDEGASKAPLGDISQEAVPTKKTTKKVVKKVVKKKDKEDLNFCGVVGASYTVAANSVATSNKDTNEVTNPMASTAAPVIKQSIPFASPPAAPVSSPTATAIGVELTEVDVPVIKCSLCDPTSKVEHTIKKTRIRISNLCCSGEEAIINSALNPFKGIESVNINLIGRYAIMKHCPEECCAPAAEMVEKLCDQRLGASIQEAQDAQEEEGRKGPELFKIIHAVVVTLLYVGAIVADKHYGDEDIAFGFYMANVLIGAAPVLKKAFDTVFIQRAVNIQVLMSVAIAGAMGAQDYNDAAIVVTLFVIAELLEDYIMGIVRGELSNTARGLVKTATLVEDGKQVPIDSLRIGDRIAVRAGDMIPVDGDVSGGQGVVDESALTGEATPVAKLIGSKVISGTVVQNGYIEVTVTVTPENSTLRRMNQAVEDVQADRGRFATVVDKFAVFWTPAILIVSLLFFVIGGGATGDWAYYLERALVLLVLACPCAVVIAAPIACVCGIAGAAKHGVLIKGSSVIEILGLINVIGVDKTGTLTKGFFSLIESVSLITPDAVAERRRGGAHEVNALQLAAALESKSAHPLANAIVAGFCGCIADMDPSMLPNVEDVKVLDGIGLQGFCTLPGKEDIVQVVVGNERLFDVNGGPCKLTEQQAVVLDAFTEKYKAATVVIVAIDDRLELCIALGDTIRPEAPVFVKGLSDMGCTVAMLTGDHKDVATETSRILGIQECQARLLPEGKHEWVKEKVSDGKYVLMLGDGINDTTALAGELPRLLIYACIP